MVEVAFFAGAIGALGGAIAVIALNNPFYSVLALIVHLISLAGLFLLLHAEFIAAAQIVVYAGAVMVLYLFVAAYVGGTEEPIAQAIPGQRFVAPLLAAALFVEVSIAVVGTSLASIQIEGPVIEAGFGSPGSLPEQPTTRIESRTSPGRKAAPSLADRVRLCRGWREDTDRRCRREADAVFSAP